MILPVVMVNFCLFTVTSLAVASEGIEGLNAQTSNSVAKEGRVEIKQGSRLCEAQSKPPEKIQQKVLGLSRGLARVSKRATGKGFSGG
jgi:hypothetical protein